MSTILDTIADAARKRTARSKQIIPAEEMIRRARAMNPDTGFPFEKALKKPGLSFICECKKASPSKGLISRDFPYLSIAREYEQAGAAAISVLTEPEWFLGSDEILREIAGSVSIPCLRKDFVVDEYMIYEAKVLGASAVLLICALLDEDTLRRYMEIADSLGLSALVEAHDPAEIETAVRSGARIIGVNNRNLKDFTVDVRNAYRLRKLVPRDILFVSESGIRTPEDIRILRDAGADAVLIGETLMRAKDRSAYLDYLKGRTRLKMCGMRRPEDIRSANRVRPDYIGFIFDPSRRRYVTPEQAAALRSELDPGIRTAGVFVNADLPDILKITEAGTIDLIQLHGQETAEDILTLRNALDQRGYHNVSIIQAFQIHGEEDIRQAFSTPADLVLLDSGAGSGQAFNWELLQNADRFRRPYILAGGITPANTGEAIRKLHPFCLDASSGLETDGKKDPVKMAEMKRRAEEAITEGTEVTEGTAEEMHTEETAGEHL
ncbi:indole-3-glycerol phosphate synthase TrpC [Eubacterium pyruvativorans]|uniref:indole-3-glycerol phosphate synthase TrpC n=1 Tax=Eubacterium pyruvativorans TaxID=155865 RepID=UPI00389998DD